ncbi:hypothetical protein Zmor_020589 [Zophobas morio]|uniref:Uncharacterized protein n=1 Tax=Zophobas morio TaxID=2755281 RepID=A0AA38MA59_9CUCU|nr:hypothetical protein Zmor_020589 [Zophobas morio]
MVRLAYPEAPPTIQERLATETFVDGIRDVEVKKVLQPSTYQTSSEVLIRALEVEAVYGSSRTCYKVSVVEREKEENNKMEKLLEKVLPQTDDLIRRLKNDVSRKQSMEYYRDGRQGRLKRDFRARLPAPRRSTQQRSHRDVKGAGTLGNVFNDENKAASEVKIRSFTRGSGSTVPGKIYENPAAITIELNCKYCDEVEQPKALLNRRKKAVVEDDEWTTARCRKDQEEDKDIGPLLRWKEDGMERPAWSEISGESPSFKTLWAQ